MCFLCDPAIAKAAEGFSFLSRRQVLKGAAAFAAGAMICEPIVGAARAQAAPAGATVYYNGDILSMEGAEPTYLEALVVKDGKIAFTGSKTEAISFAGDGATEVDLQGKTLLPGFIDAHGHVYNSGFQKLSANLLPPPDGECKDIDSLVEITKEWAGRNANAI